MKKMMRKTLLVGIVTALAGCVKPPPPPPPPPPPMCCVDARPMTPAAAALSAAVGSQVRGELTQRGYWLLKDRRAPQKGQEMVSIDLVIDRREAARLEKWVAYDATVSAKVVADNGRLLGEKTFETKGRRGSSVPEAEAGISKSLSSQLMSWLPGILPPPVVK